MAIFVIEKLNYYLQNERDWKKMYSGIKKYVHFCNHTIQRQKVKSFTDSIKQI